MKKLTIAQFCYETLHMYTHTPEEQEDVRFRTDVEEDGHTINISCTCFYATMLYQFCADHNIIIEWLSVHRLRDYEIQICMTIKGLFQGDPKTEKIPVEKNKKPGTFLENPDNN